MLHVAQLLPGSSKAKGPQTVVHYPVVEGAAARLDSACLPGNARSGTRDLCICTLEQEPGGCWTLLQQH